MEIVTTAASPGHVTLLKPGEKMSREGLRTLLEVVCDESGFLVEKKLIQILTDIPKDNRCLMTLDSIFKVLKVTAEEDLQLLSR